MMNTSVNIGNHTWEVTFSDSKEIQFSYVETHIENTDPLWHTWEGASDTEDIYKTYEFGDMTIPNEINPITLVNKIMDAAIHLIKKSHTSFFFFSASTNRKGMFYTNILQRFLQKIGKHWKYQIIDNQWYYITKTND